MKPRDRAYLDGAVLAGTKQKEDLKVPLNGVPILHFKLSLLEFLLKKGDDSESDLMDQGTLLLLGDLSDMQIHLRVITLERVVNLVRRMSPDKLGAAIWEMLEALRFGNEQNKERTLHCLQENLELADTRNAKLLCKLWVETTTRADLNQLVELGAVEMQWGQVITDAPGTLVAIIAGIEVEEDVHQPIMEATVEIKKWQMEVLKQLLFMLIQPDEEEVQTKKKEVASNVLENLTLQNTFPWLMHADRALHANALEVINQNNDEAMAKEPPQLPELYRKNDVSPYEDWAT